MANSSSSVISLKLLIDTESKRVLFAEAGKDCVDFLFYILSLPVAKLISLLGKEGMVGSLSNLYESIESLNESYIQPNQTRDTLLKHVSSVTAGSSIPLLSINAPPAPATKKRKFYRCNCSHAPVNDYYFENDFHLCRSSGNRPGNENTGFVHVADDARAVCPTCSKKMDRVVEYVEYGGAAAVVDEPAVAINKCGFVKGVVTYMVMDDLAVKPMSAISSIPLLNELNVNNVCALQEKVVNLGMNEAVELLKASLETKNVLTRVFIKDLGSSSTVYCDQRDTEEVVVICNKRRCLRRHSTRRRRQSVGLLGRHSRFFGFK